MRHVFLHGIIVGLFLANSTKCVFRNSRGVLLFQEKKGVCGKHIDHGVVVGWLVCRIHIHIYVCTYRYIHVQAVHIHTYMYVCICMCIASRQFQFSTIFVEIFKYAYEHIPCVESACTAKYKSVKCRIWQAGQIQTMPAPNIRFQNLSN